MAEHVVGWDGARYDRVSDPQARWGAPLLGRLTLEAPGAVIDAGCGSGRVTELLLDQFPHASVICLDASDAMLDEARVRLARFGDRVAYVQDDLSRDLALGCAVDAVFSSAVFHWVRDHDALFQRLAAVLRPGGQLVAQWGGAGNVASVIEAMGRVGLATDHWTFPGLAETADRLDAAGFVIDDLWIHEEPTDFADDGALAEFIATVMLVDQPRLRDAASRQMAAREVGRLLPRRSLDYVRISVVAHRA